MTLQPEAVVISSEPIDSTVDAIKIAFDQLNSLYQQQPFSAADTRRQLLMHIKRNLLKHQSDLVKAMSEDFGYRSEFDSQMGDIIPSIEHINYTLRKLKSWMKPSHRSAGMQLSPSKVKVFYQPKGVVGIIVPWNFPVNLCFGPLITALAAGNRAMVKLSEFTPATNQVLRKVFADFSDHIKVIEGEGVIGAEFSKLPFDHLFFTGSTQVGRLVAMEAAKNLTPVTLELGGKSPVIVAPDADIDLAVNSLVLGKNLNAGQICVAPDYVLIPKGKSQAFISAYKQQVEEVFRQSNCHEYTHIINERQLNRLESYLDDARQKGAQIIEIDVVNQRHPLALKPSLITDVNDEMLVMKEEIFGPLLPIIEYEELAEATERVNQRQRPLALYLISNDKHTRQLVLEGTHSGGMSINDSLLHVAAGDAPFGGVGHSGMGHYHGVEGFRTFSHAKTTLITPAWLPRNKILLKYREQALKWLSRLFGR